MTGQEAPGSESGYQTAIEPAGLRVGSGNPRRICLPWFRLILSGGNGLALTLSKEALARGVVGSVFHHRENPLEAQGSSHEPSYSLVLADQFQVFFSPPFYVRFPWPAGSTATQRRRVRASQHKGRSKGRGPGHPRTSNTFFVVLQHTESGAGAIFELSGIMYSNGSAVSLLS